MYCDSILITILAHFCREPIQTANELWIYFVLGVLSVNRIILNGNSIDKVNTSIGSANGVCRGMVEVRKFNQDCLHLPVLEVEAKKLYSFFLKAHIEMS